VSATDLGLLAALIEGLDASAARGEGVFVIGATPDLRALDAALWQPGKPRDHPRRRILFILLSTFLKGMVWFFIQVMSCSIGRGRSAFAAEPSLS
jgi:hypothetical protein